ncbi:predicted protein [Naegleria gruberi]|uniref:Predicted protein n=1 Tax=Naegleria gruberi TaxID=5762 RepID=D2VIU8_NAEGR|nr:uncharacterized protein NAEGRDRAFT_68807 [Naegleria gruberi]EFC43336.1 predicted protein [Naegleria gruberi]|eukprot:XP_002676080.1 predicted protein [Naegleria gruberi strain NEG-M]
MANSTIYANQTYCDEALFNLPSSIYLDSIPQIINGVCPDTIFTPISSSLVLLNHLIIVFVGLAGVIYKRNNAHIRYRSPVYLYWSMFASTLLVGISCLRFMIGRTIFPCPLHAVTFFIFPQVLMMPSILKCFRVFLLYRINLEKSKVHNEARFSIAVKEKGIELESKELSEGSPAVGTPELNTSSSNIMSIATDDDRSSEAGEALSEISTTQTRKIKILEFLASTKFATIIYISLLIFHLCFWLIFSGIDQAISNSGNPGKTIVLQVGLLDFTKGCVSSSNAVLLVAAQCIFYLIIEIIVFVLFAFFTDRDTWGMKRETFVLISFQVVAAILYIALGSIGIIKTLVDYFVAYAHVILIYVGLELCVNVVAPVGYAFMMDWKEGRGEEMDTVGGFLQDKKNVENLLDFARRR